MPEESVGSPLRRRSYRYRAQVEGQIPYIFLYKWCITGLTITATVWLNAYLLRRENDRGFLPGVPHLDRIFYFSGLILLFITLFLELQYQMNMFYEQHSFRLLAYGLYVCLFASVVAWIRRDRGAHTWAIYRYMSSSEFSPKALFPVDELKELLEINPVRQ